MLEGMPLVTFKKEAEVIVNANIRIESKETSERVQT